MNGNRKLKTSIVDEKRNLKNVEYVKRFKSYKIQKFKFFIYYIFYYLKSILKYLFTNNNP